MKKDIKQFEEIFEFGKSDSFANVYEVRKKKAKQHNFLNVFVVVARTNLPLKSDSKLEILDNTLSKDELTFINKKFDSLLHTA